jgi:hypothetical protein
LSATDERSPILAPFQGALVPKPLVLMRRFLIPAVALFCLITGLAFGLYGPYFPRPFGIPILVLAAISIWALPESKSAPDRTMELLFFAFLGALILWPNYLAIVLPGLPWLTLLRVVSMPMALLFLISLSVSSAFRAKLAGIVAAAPIVWKLIVGFAVIQGLTVIFSDSVFTSLQKVIIAQVNWTIVFFISCYVFAKPGRPTLWAALFCATVAPISAIGFKEHLDSKLPWVGHIPRILKIADPAVARTLQGGFRDGEYRIEATFSTALGLGEYCALVMPFLLYFALGRRNIWIRLLCLAAIPVLFQIVLWTDSRLGLIGCIVGVALYGLLAAIHRWRTQKGSILAPALVLAYPAIAAAALTVVTKLRTVQSRVVGEGQYDDSNQSRIEMYRHGIPKVLQAPWGHGSGQGASVLGFTDPSGFLTIDTYIMRVALEYGVLGFTCYFGAIALSTWTAGRGALLMKDQRSEEGLLVPLCVALVVFVIIKTVFSNEDNHPLIFIMMGMVVALRARSLATQPGTAAAAGGVAAPQRPVRRQPSPFASLAKKARK